MPQNPILESLVKKIMPQPPPVQTGVRRPLSQVIEGQNPLISGTSDFLSGLFGIGEDAPLGPNAKNAGALFGILAPVLGGLSKTAQGTRLLADEMGSSPLLDKLYSRLDKVVNAVPSKQISSAKLKQLSTQLASPEESRWRGFSNFIDGLKGGNVNTQEARDFLEQNPLKVSEKTYRSERAHKDEAEFHRLADQYHSFDPNSTDTWMSPSEVNDLRNLADFHRDTKWKAHTLTGGSNYQERVITLPQNDINFSSHAFNDPNILVWSRLKDREAGNLALRNLGNDSRDFESNDPSKWLFSEETQSDWGQKGQKSGFGDSNEAFTKWLQESKGFSSEHANQVSQMSSGRGADSYRSEFRNTIGEPGPDMPFKTTWPDLAIKRDLLEAADKGYSGYAWTPASVQNRRNNLSQVVDELRWEPHATIPDSGHLTGYQHFNGTNLIQVDSRVVPNHELGNYVGQDAAKSLMSQGQFDTRTELGGQGMRQFYDQTIPNKVQKLVGPYGGKVEPVGVLSPHSGAPAFDVPETTPGWGKQPQIMGVRLTPDLIQNILKRGFPLLSLSGFLANQPKGQYETPPSQTTIIK